MDTAFRRAMAEAREHGDLYFAGLLPEDLINKAFGKASSLWQGWIYTPAVTVWVFLSQCFSSDHSCRDAVARHIAWRLAQGLDPCSAQTGAYCTARDDLPEDACRQMVEDTGRQVDEEAPPEWRWNGHRVLDVDGSTLTMPDTPENQAEYPQQSSQKRGCGLPIVRILVVFSLAVGTVLHAAISKYQGKQTGENSLFRKLHDQLLTGDVVLADRYFSGWFDMALLKQRGVEIVVRKHQLRATDFRRGQRLGHDDHVVCWSKPARPEWMSKEQYDALPDSLKVREVRVRVEQKGFRTRELVVVTTLLDADKYPATEIAKLYRRRWQAELNLRSLKTVLQMDHLRCKTPHRVRNEFYIHLLAYNLIRRVMAVAAFRAEVEPWTVSFKGTMQTLNHLLPVLSTSVSTADWCEAVLAAIATHVVGNRPDRFEPRVRKRRPKPYKLMTEPRENYKKRAA
ncbi:MAG TPA: IS4 family transposase [Pirellulales bacterium]|nr:IS4 family transposase [Pirellulales bacterium]